MSECILSHSFNWHWFAEKSKKLCCTFHHYLQIKPFLKSEVAKQGNEGSLLLKRDVAPAWVQRVSWEAWQGWEACETHTSVKMMGWDNTRKWHGSKYIWKWKGYAAAGKVYIFQSKNRWRDRWQQLLSAAHEQWCSFLHQMLITGWAVWVNEYMSLWQHLYAKRVFRLITGTLSMS